MTLPNIREEMRQDIYQLINKDVINFRDVYNKNILPHDRDQMNMRLVESSLNTLLDAVEKCVPEEQELPKTKCINAENHLFGACFQCEKIKGFNNCRNTTLQALKEFRK